MGQMSVLMVMLSLALEHEDLSPAQTAPRYNSTICLRIRSVIKSVMTGGHQRTDTATQLS
jgi:hypothetical protein